jgi:hypothetical protein
MMKAKPVGKIELFFKKELSSLWFVWIFVEIIGTMLIAIVSLICMPFVWLLGNAKDTEMDKMIRAEEKKHYGR